MNTELMFSSKTDLWETPQDLFDKYDAIYHFETDVCALPENAKCKRFFTPEMDGLKQEWGEKFEKIDDNFRVYKVKDHSLLAIGEKIGFLSVVEVQE